MSNLVATKPELTVILPTRGENLDYLEECLRSIEQQTLETFSFLVLIDGNPEVFGAVSALVARCVSRPSRILLSSKRRGVSRSCNLLCRLATTKYIARMDDDDRCHPERLRVSLSAIKENDMDVLGTAARIMDGKGRITGLAYGLDFSTEPGVRDYIFGPVFFHPSVMYRRNWILRHRYSNSWANGQDRELWLRTRGAKFMNLKRPLIDYRVRPAIAPVYRKALRNKRSLITKVRPMVSVVEYTQLLAIFMLESIKVYLRPYTMRRRK